MAEQDRQQRLADMLAQLPISMGTYENEAKRLGNYPAPQGYEFGPLAAQDMPPNDMLPPPEYRGESMSGMFPNADSPQRVFLKDMVAQQPQAEQQLPQNYVINNRTGKQVPITDIYGNPSQSVATPATNMGAVQVDTPYGRGRYMKGDSTRVVLDDGRIVDLGRDTGRERAIEKENLALQKQRAEMAQMRGGGGSEYDKELQRKLAGAKVEEMLANQPGSMAYKRIQDEKLAKQKIEDKKAEDVKKATDAKDYAINQLSALDKAVQDVIKAPGLSSATGWFDNMTANWMSLSPSAKADARAYIKQLQDVSQVVGLSDLRQAGIAPGSITEREWPKFQAMLGNINPDLSDEEFAKQMQYIAKTVRTAKRELNGEVGKQKLTQEDADAMTWAMKNPNDPRSAKIKARLGVK